MSNITTATFEDGCVTTITKELWQWDYGQILQFPNLELPESYEVHFGNTVVGLAPIQIGNADGVQIPDILLAQPEAITAWVFLHVGDSDGETRYQVTIPVIPRAKPFTGDVPPVQQSAITQAISLLNSAVDDAEESAAAASQSATDAAGSASSASASAMQANRNAAQSSSAATGAAGSASIAGQQASIATSKAEQAANSASQAANSAEVAAEAAAVLDSARIIKKATGQIIPIDDALVGSEPVSAPAGTVVYNRNAFPANITTRTSNGVTFTQDANDPNTVTLNGTATGNAYSYAGITAANAAALLEPGRYYIASYADTSETYPILYADVINYETGVKTAIGNVGVMNSVYALTLTAKSYLGVRVQLASGNTVSNLTVHVYISPVMPDYEYVPYTAPNGTFKAHSVMVLPAAGNIEYYGYYNPPATPYSLRIATFNVGEYDHGASTYPDTPADFDAYAQAIAEIGADILLTQEDRVYKSVAGQITTWDALYQYMYSYGGIVSNSISTNGMMAKGIYSNIPLYQPMRVTFTTQAANYWSSMTVYLASVAGKIVLLLSAHLAPRETNASVRAAQIAEIMQYVSNLAPDYCIIAGDLNTWTTAELDAFTGYVKANCGPFGQIVTYPTGSHFFDNILVTPNIKLQGVKAVLNSLGDHYALAADIVLV